MYPLSKYRFYTNGNKVVAVSTYAGRTVRGVAKCAENDNFDLDKGRELAAARCAEKVAIKRFHRASTKLREAKEAFMKAKEHYDRMKDYYYDADEILGETSRNLDFLLKKM